MSLAVFFWKFGRYGFRGRGLGLIESYFANKHHNVYIDGQWSGDELMEIGVTQGSILGPLMFLVFINDFSEHMSSTNHNLWADDSSFFLGSRDLLVVLRAKEWFIANGLCCNDQKTDRLVFTLRKDMGVDVNLCSDFWEYI